jgi:hypothetical protein
MLGNGWKRKWKGIGEFSDSGVALGEASEDGAAGGVRESGEDGIERGGFIVNHTVYCYGLSLRCQASFLSGCAGNAWRTAEA